MWMSLRPERKVKGGAKCSGVIYMIGSGDVIGPEGSLENDNMVNNDVNPCKLCLGVSKAR